MCVSETKPLPQRISFRLSLPGGVAWFLPQAEGPGGCALKLLFYWKIIYICKRVFRESENPQGCGAGTLYGINA